MFIGHYGIAMAAKRAAPACSLGTLIFAAQFLDLIWPILLLLGWEHVRIAPGITRTSPLDFQDYPISHSLLAAVAWSVLVAWGISSCGATVAEPWSSLWPCSVIGSWSILFIGQISRFGLTVPRWAWDFGIRGSLASAWRSWASAPGFCSMHARREQPMRRAATPSGP